MNQKSRQEPKNNIEKDFYKLMNNSNFDYDCWNILDNWKFVPIFDEFKEITYIGRYWSFFDSRISQLVTTNLIKQDIEEKYNNKLIKLDNQDKFYALKLNTINDQRLSDLKAADNLEKKKNKNKKRLNLLHFSERKSKALRNQKVKAWIEFDEEYSSNIKSLAIKQSHIINLTTRYLNGKIFIFSKVSIKSFLYDLINVFMFPNEEIKKIYAEFKVDWSIFIKT